MKTAEREIRVASKKPTPPPAPAPGRVISSKILTRHLEKLAIVYVRQSSPQQVLENRESTARQTAFPHILAGIII